MANETTVKVSADASGYTAELDRARKSAQAFSEAQAVAAKRVQVAQQAIAEAAASGSKASASAINNFVSQLARTADQAGKTKAQLLDMKAAQLGISSSVSGYISQMESAAESTEKMSFATVGAKRELLVLAHELSQGNYKRAAGSVMVLGERINVMGSIMSATGAGVGLFVAAIVLAGIELFKTASAIDTLNKSSTATNGYLGLTSGQLADMAASLAPANGGLVEVTDTMAVLISSGHASADTLAELTGVVTQFGKDTGMTADKAAEAFVKMIDDPKKGIEELQSKYHEFSAAQIEVIEGYIKTGNTAQATKALIDAVADSQSRMAAQGTKDIGFLAAAWQSFAAAAKQAGDNFDRMGMQASATDKLSEALQRQNQAQRDLQSTQSRNGGSVAIATAQHALDAANAQVAALQKVQTAQQATADANKKRAAGGDAQLALNSYLSDTTHAGPGKKRDTEIAEENAKWAALVGVEDKGSAKYQQALKDHYETIQAINDQYAKKTHVKTNEGGINAELTRLAGQNQLIEQEEKRTETVLKSQRDAGLIDTVTYFSKLHDAQANALNQEIANAQQRVDVATEKKQKSAMETALKDYQGLVAQRVAVEQNYTDSIAKYAAQRADNLKKYSDSQNGVTNKQQDAYTTQYVTRNMSPQDKADYTDRLKVETDYEAQRQALLLQYDSPTADKLEYQQKLVIAQQAYTDQYNALEVHLALQQTMRDSYSEQISKSLTGLAGNSQTIAEDVGSGFTSVFGTMESALESFVTTGKFNFSSFAASVLDDMAKIALKAAETQIFSMLLGSFSGGSGGILDAVGGGVQSFATGGGVYGAGTSTSDSIPAMLSNGEYVIHAGAAKKYGGLLDAINSGKMAHFASGGAVGSVSGSSSSDSSGSSPVSVTVNNNGSNGLNDSDAKDLHTMVTAFVDKRMSQKMRGQGGYAYQLRYGQI